MKRQLVIEPIFNKSRICSFTVFRDFEFSFNHIQNLDSSNYREIYFRKDLECYCYNIFRLHRTLGDQIPFVWDIKTLSELRGYRFKSFIQLAKKILGDEKVTTYLDLSDKVHAFMRSYEVVKINFQKFDNNLVFPENLLGDLYKERATLTLDLFNQFKLDLDLLSFYKDHFNQIERKLFQIQKPIQIDTQLLKNVKTYHVNTFKSNLDNNGQIRLHFKPVGQKTGRLSFESKTVNMYVLPKEVRNLIKAKKNHKIVQMDFKSFQPRLAIAATNNEKFKSTFEGVEDIYSVFPGDREENKLKFLIWMFHPAMHNELFSEVAAPIVDLKNEVFEKSARDGKIKNPFGRTLYYTGEEKHVIFQNYITSLEADAVLRIFDWLFDFLKDTKSRILFPFHDAIVMEMHDDDIRRGLNNSVANGMEDFYLDEIFRTRFPVEQKSGDNFGELI